MTTTSDSPEESSVAPEQSDSTTIGPDGPSAPLTEGALHSLEAASTKRKITRSRIGCFTCRRRKKACDLGKPICQGCTRLGLECEWPTNYQDTLPKKRAAEALAAAARATGRTDMLEAESRSRSASRARDAKKEANGAGGEAHEDSNARFQAEHGYSPPSRRSSVVGSTYEEEPWAFSERLSYIHGDPSDMFDIYDDSPATAPQQPPNYASQTIQAQGFNPQLPHRSSAPGFMQLYSHGQNHGIHHSNNADQFHPPHTAGQTHVPPAMYQSLVGGGVTFHNNESGPSSRTPHANYHNGLLSNTGLSLTMNPTSLNHHRAAPTIHKHNQTNLNAFNWNNQANENHTGQVNLDDVRRCTCIIQSTIDSRYLALHAVTCRRLLPCKWKRRCHAGSQPAPATSKASRTS